MGQQIAVIAKIILRVMRMCDETVISSTVMCIYLCDARQLSAELAQSWVLLWLDVLLKLCCYLTSTQVKQYCRKLNCVCLCACVCVRTCMHVCYV